MSFYRISRVKGEQHFQTFTCGVGYLAYGVGYLAYVNNIASFFYTSILSYVMFFFFCFFLSYHYILLYYIKKILSFWQIEEINK